MGGNSANLEETLEVPLNDRVYEKRKKVFQIFDKTPVKLPPQAGHRTPYLDAEIS